MAKGDATEATDKVEQDSSTAGTLKARRSIVERWGGNPTIVDEEGFVPVPTAFLKYHAVLRPRLKAAEAMFVLQLMTYKWDKQAPYPGYKTLAQRMGVSEVYARKIARALEEKGYLHRKVRVSQTNQFDLQPLFEKLVAHIEKVAQQKQRKRAEAAAAE